MAEEDDAFYPLLGYASMALATAKEEAIYIRRLLEPPVTEPQARRAVEYLKGMEKRLDDALLLLEPAPPPAAPEQSEVDA